MPNRDAGPQIATASAATLRRTQSRQPSLAAYDGIERICPIDLARTPASRRVKAMEVGRRAR